MAKKHQDGFGIPVDTRTLLSVGQVGATVLGKAAPPLQAGFEMAGTSMDIHTETQNAATLLGQDVRSLNADSKAFKKYVKELSSLYEERLMNLGVGMAGSAAGAAALTAGMAAFSLGPPGWIAGLAATAAGGIGASVLKEKIFPSKNRQFLDFASRLQNAGQQGQLPPEAAFVALVMNLPDAKLIGQIIKNFPPEAGIRSVNDMVKALDSEQGREYLRMAMMANDDMLRASPTTGGPSIAGGVTISEQFAQAINSGKMAGVDLLSSEKTTQMGTLINMAQSQQMMQETQIMSARNPNEHLPNMAIKNDKHLSI